ncbi:MAG: hypothetical protein ACO3A1_08190 [Flavobacteriaceae bacterium]
MTDKDVFRNKEEELQRLTQEIADIKSALKDISMAVGRIERHVKRSFGVPEKPKNPSVSSNSKKETTTPKDLPAITPEEALSLFDEFSLIFRDKGSIEVEKKLKSMNVLELKLMAHELGVTFSSKPSIKALCSGIIGRLNERAMLSRNVNVTPSQKEQMQTKNDSDGA